MNFDSMNMDAPHTLRELGQCAENAQCSGEPVTLTYRNWRGEVAERTIVPLRVWWGSTEWHPEPQWLLTAFDVEKGADRDFALRDFSQPAAPTVAVKPLVWSQTPPAGYEYESFVYWAAGLGGHYRVEPDGTLWMANDGFVWGKHANQAVAKAAAQADYASRILAQIEPAQGTVDLITAELDRRLREEVETLRAKCSPDVMAVAGETLKRLRATAQKGKA